MIRTRPSLRLHKNLVYKENERVVRRSLPKRPECNVGKTRTENRQATEHDIWPGGRRLLKCLQILIEPRQLASQFSVPMHVALDHQHCKLSISITFQYLPQNKEVTVICIETFCFCDQGQKDPRFYSSLL